MKVGILQEAIRTSNGDDRYHEMIEEAVAAEAAGFDFYGVSEQHFARYYNQDPTAAGWTSDIAAGDPNGFVWFHIPAPEVFLAYVGARTSRIRLRPMSVVMLPFNHPVRVAEQLNTLDFLTNGRAELGGARSNNPHTLDGFGIPPTETRVLRDEFIRLLAKALSEDPFEFHGKLYDIPPRSLSPKSIQKPHPPIFISATGVDSHHYAGQNGIGVMTGNTILGWEYVQDCFDAYKESIARAEPIAGFINNSQGVACLVVNCAKTMEEARAIAAPAVFNMAHRMIQMYTSLSDRSPDYAYLGQIEKVRKYVDDLDVLLDSAPYFQVGTPEYLIERFKRLEKMGANEVILRIDGFGHANHMKAIEMIGEYVIPKLR